jgi:hypothetical protein
VEVILGIGLGRDLAILLAHLLAQRVDVDQ